MKIENLMKIMVLEDENLKRDKRKSCENNESNNRDYFSFMKKISDVFYKTTE